MVALDPSEEICEAGIDAIEKWMHGLAKLLTPTGVCLKVNMLLRLFGFQLIRILRDTYGLRVCADLKLHDTYSTLERDALVLRLYAPEFLTVHAQTSVPTLQRVREILQKTKVLGVTVLTEQDSDYTQEVFGGPLSEAVLRMADRAARGMLDGVVAAPKEIALLREHTSLSIACPDVRPAKGRVHNDNQNLSRSMTPFEAITAHAEWVIVGRPITLAARPFDATMSILEEIADAQRARQSAA
jgi:orotidine-5'-phosphate decarboxylase